MRTFTGITLNGLAYDWTQHVLVATQQELANAKIRLLDINGGDVNTVADGSHPPSLLGGGRPVGGGKSINNFEVDPTRSLMYVAAAWNTPKQVTYDTYTVNPSQSQWALPAIVDLTENVGSLAAGVSANNTWVHRTPQYLYGDYVVNLFDLSPLAGCRVNPFAFGFAAAPALLIVELTTTTTTTTEPPSTTTGGTTTTTTGGSTTTGGTTSTTTLPSTSTLGPADPSCWEMTAGVVRYPEGKYARIYQNVTDAQQISQVVSAVPAGVKLVFSVNVEALATPTTLLINEVGGSLLTSMTVTTVGVYRLEFTLDYIRALRFTVRVGAGGSGAFTQIRDVSLRSCAGV
jgi:hypothetical protein